MPEPVDAPPVDAVTDAVAELYQLAPDEFVAGRATLAKELRASGRRAEAAAVNKRRRPTPGSWALNRVAREAPSIVEDALRTGAALRDAMGDAFAGDASGVRAAEAAHRTAAEAVVRRGAHMAAAAGRPLSDTHEQRMTSTVRAAILDDAVAAAWRAGTLDADLEGPAFGVREDPGGERPAERVGAAADQGHPTAAGPTATRPAPDRPDAKAVAAARARRAELARLRADAARLARQAERLDAAARDARAQADALAGEAAAAAASASEAARALADAEAAAAALDP